MIGIDEYSRDTYPPLMPAIAFGTAAAICGTVWTFNDHRAYNLNINNLKHTLSTYIY